MCQTILIHNINKQSNVQSLFEADFMFTLRHRATG